MRTRPAPRCRKGLSRPIFWKGTRLLAAALAGLAVLTAAPGPSAAEKPDVPGFARIAVLSGGRIKPVDSVARDSLRRIRGKQTLKVDGRRMSAAEWLLELAAGTPQADSRRIFRIEDPDVLGLLGRRRTRDKYYSFADLGPSLDRIMAQGARASQMEVKSRSRFERAVYDLSERLELYQRLRNSFWVPDGDDPAEELARFRSAMAQDLPSARSGAGGHGQGLGSVPFQDIGRDGPFQHLGAEHVGLFIDRFRMLAGLAYFKPIPPGPGRPPEEWSNIGEALLDGLRTGALPPGTGALAGMASSYRKGDAAGFDRDLADLRSAQEGAAPAALRRAGHEAFFNRVQPFSWGLILYVAVFLTGCVSWLAWTKPLEKSAFRLLSLAFILHTVGVFSRMALQGRPPVTNLYSSAVFVGWSGVLLCLVLERLNRRGIASVVGGAVGFCTLLLAHNLAMSGDTMEMMQAVLDSNFWLGVHVVTIIIGYGATFLAGAFAHVHILRRWLGRLDRPTGQSLAQMTYGVVCLALLFTFIGTVLGGIWADQSWGRFWGWDPKENGALLMLLWQAMILHARWDGTIRERGLMAMAVFGNILTALTWFGVNMLGVGLHSYGFMDKAFFWLTAFVACQAVVMILGVLPPLKEWRSARLRPS